MKPLPPFRSAPIRCNRPGVLTGVGADSSVVQRPSEEHLSILARQAARQTFNAASRDEVGAAGCGEPADEESSTVAFKGEDGDLPDLLTADETAGYLRCSLRTLRRLETAGYLTPVRVGRRTLRYRRDDVRRLVDQTLSKRIEGSMQGQSGKKLSPKDVKSQGPEDIEMK